MDFDLDESNFNVEISTQLKTATDIYDKLYLEEQAKSIAALQKAQADCRSLGNFLKDFSTESVQHYM
jgi:hypothetical protein